MPKVKPQLLSPKDLDGVVRIARGWPNYTYPEVLKLLQHIAAITQSFEHLQNSIQADIFKKPDLVKPMAQYPEFQKPKGLPEKFPLARRLQIMIEEGERGGELWKLTLKHNQLSEENADKIINGEHETLR